MNLNFADISGSFLNMVHQDLPKSVPADADTTMGSLQKSSFADRLKESMNRPGNPIKTADNHSQPEKNRIEKTGSNRSPETSDRTIQAISEELGSKKGVAFVAALKNIFLMMSNGDLDDISFDADGLESLKKMLLKAGFKEEAVNELLARLTEESEGTGLVLGDFMDQLFDLPVEEEAGLDEGSENFLALSAIPVLESLLGALGIEQEKIEEILSAADRGDKGLSLDVVIEKLQDIQKTSFYSQNSYETARDDKSFQMLFKQLGLEATDAASGSDLKHIDLNGLVRSLEQLRHEMSGRNTPDASAAFNNGILESSEKPLDLVSALFKGLEMKNKETGTKEGTGEKVFSFSSDQIKNQVNHTLNPGGQSQTAKEKAKAGEKPESMSFDPQAGKTDARVSEMDNQGQKVKSFLKEVRSEKVKSPDQIQVSTSETKAESQQTGVDSLKTRPSFRNLPTHVTQQVGKSLVRAINQGENTLRIQLKPPELGRLVMTIDNSGDTMKVRIVTESHMARDVLASNLNELKTVLSNSGVNLERVEVDMSSDFRQSMADARNPAGDSGRQNRNRGKQLSDAAGTETSANSINISDDLSSDSTVHLVA